MAGSPVPPAGPQRGRTPWGLILGIGCGGCAVLAVIIGIVSFVLVRTVAQKTPLPAAQQSYTGDWQGADGTTLTIRADGTGGFVAGNSNVSGGQATIDESKRTLTIKLMGISRTWAITEPPHEADGETVMSLDGMLFRRTSGFAPTNSGTSDGADSGTTDGGTGGTTDDVPSSAVPSGEDLVDLVTGDLVDFNEALAEEDFGTFYESIHPIWKGQTTPADLKSSFQVFIDKEIDLGGIENVEPQFEGTPQTDENGVMTVTGVYPTTPNQVHFKMKYLPDAGIWKLVGVDVNVR